MYLFIDIVNNLEENQENENVVHQDDDGFESLNGNVSSDNDREALTSKDEDNLAKTPDHEKDKAIDETVKQEKFPCNTLGNIKYN